MPLRIPVSAEGSTFAVICHGDPLPLVASYLIYQGSNSINSHTRELDCELSIFFSPNRARPTAGRGRSGRSGGGGRPKAERSLVASSGKRKGDFAKEICRVSPFLFARLASRLRSAFGLAPPPLASRPPTRALASLDLERKRETVHNLRVNSSVGSIGRPR